MKRITCFCYQSDKTENQRGNIECCCMVEIDKILNWQDGCQLRSDSRRWFLNPSRTIARETRVWKND